MLFAVIGQSATSKPYFHLADLNLSRQSTSESNNAWLTYRNDKFLFSIDYPSDWILDDTYGSTGVVFLRTPARREMIQKGGAIPLFDIAIKVYDSPAALPDNQSDGLSFQQWIAKKASGYGLVNVTSTIIAGVPGFGGREAGIGLGGHVAFVESSNGNIYEISGDPNLKSNDWQMIVDRLRFFRSR
jgi:hypothetical protein